MSLDGSGGYSLPAGQPVVTGTTISSTTHNTLASDLDTALDTAFYRDGQATATANTNWGGFRLTNIAAGTALTDAARVSQVQNNSVVYLSSVAGTNTVTGTATPTPAYTTGQAFEFVPANTNTAATTLNVSSLGAKNVFWNGVACVGGELRQNIPCRVIYDGTQFHIIANGFNTPFLDSHAIVVGSSDSTKKARLEVDGQTTALTRVLTTQDQDFTIGSVARSHLAGLTLSTAGSSATMSIAAGQATDSTNVMMMNLASAISKTTSAWAVGSGNGGIDTGAVATGTWYHFYLIMRPDTGVVDVLFSLSASAPTMPTNYTLKRRIGSGKTDGSSQWVAFIQDGDLFQWLATVLDITAANAGTSAVTRTLASVPTGVNVLANLQVMVTNTSFGQSGDAYISDLATNDEAAGTTEYDVGSAQVAAGNFVHMAGRITVRTNTSAQVRSRQTTTDASVTLYMRTLGWSDRRGRDT